MSKPFLLIILDGWGYSKEQKYNAIYKANPEFYNYLLNTYPNTLLHASGKYVGLLDNMIGNSEVGHLTIGAGRIIEQPVSFITRAIEDGSFFDIKLLTESLEQLKISDSTLHIMGLLSDAGVHSLDYHLYAFLEAAKNIGLNKVVVHPFLDGRDVPPKSAAKYLEKLENKLSQLGFGSIGTIHGRFYAMDRDQHFERIEKSYRILTQPDSPVFNSWRELLNFYYSQNITDEFIPPSQLKYNSQIKSGDGVIFFNFRADRARELTRAIVDPNFAEFERPKINLSWMITPVSYRQDLPTQALFHQEIVSDTLFDHLQLEKKTIFTIAETEKYAHVTYFFNGGREIVHERETRILIPSIRKNSTYASTPCMSAPEITHAVIESLLHNPQDFYLINFANADMVGHSGDFDATVKAIKCLDKQLKMIYNSVIKLNGTLYITADHGNAEIMYDEKIGQSKTAHTNNMVPFIFINQDIKDKKISLPLNQLAHIAPFIIEQMKNKI